MTLQAESDSQRLRGELSRLADGGGGDTPLTELKEGARAAEEAAAAASRALEAAKVRAVYVLYLSSPV
jgi:hypothetical protein